MLLCAESVPEGTSYPPPSDLGFPEMGITTLPFHSKLPFRLHYKELPLCERRADVTKTGNLSVENFERCV